MLYFIPFIILALFSCSLPVVTQIRGHIAGLGRNFHDFDDFDGFDAYRMTRVTTHPGMKCRAACMGLLS